MESATVMTGLVPVIHVLVAARKTWMRGTSPRMTVTNERNPLPARWNGRRGQITMTEGDPMQRPATKE